jgi:hypothetical protein
MCIAETLKGSNKQDYHNGRVINTKIYQLKMTNPSENLQALHDVLKFFEIAMVNGEKFLQKHEYPEGEVLLAANAPAEFRTVSVFFNYKL